MGIFTTTFASERQRDVARSVLISLLSDDKATANHLLSDTGLTGKDLEAFAKAANGLNKRLSAVADALAYLISDAEGQPVPQEDAKEAVAA